MVKKSKKKKSGKKAEKALKSVAPATPVGELAERSWKKLSIEQKSLYVRLLREDGFSYEAIGEFFGVNKNPVVGFNNHHLHLPPGVGWRKGPIQEEQFKDVLDIHHVKELRAQGVIVGDDVWDEKIPQNSADAEDVERAIAEGAVARFERPKRRSRRAEEPTTEAREQPAEKNPTEASIPSFAEPPFLPPSESPAESKAEPEPTEAAPSEEILEESATVETPVPEMQEPSISEKELAWQSPTRRYSDMPASSPTVSKNVGSAEDSSASISDAEEAYGPFEPTCKWPDASGRICKNKAEWKKGSNFCTTHQLNKRLLRDSD